MLNSSAKCWGAARMSAAVTAALLVVLCCCTTTADAQPKGILPQYYVWSNYVKNINVKSPDNPNKPKEPKCNVKVYNLCKSKKVTKVAISFYTNNGNFGSKEQGFESRGWFPIKYNTSVTFTNLVYKAQYPPSLRFSGGTQTVREVLRAPSRQACVVEYKLFRFFSNIKLPGLFWTKDGKSYPSCNRAGAVSRRFQPVIDCSTFGSLTHIVVGKC